MNIRGQRLLLWTTPAAGALLLFAFVMFPAVWPPMSPTMTPQQVAAFYQENLAAMRAVVIMCNILAGALVPIFAITAVHMLRIVNSSKGLAISYIAAIPMTVTAFILADYCWGVALYRPDRDPQLISLLNDMGWFFFIAPVGPMIAMNLCLAAAIYLDANPEPVFPRWLAPFNIVTAVLLVPGAFAVIDKTGPLAMNGGVSFSLRMAVIALYLLVMFFVLLRVVNRQLEVEGVPE